MMPSCWTNQAVDSRRQFLRFLISASFGLSLAGCTGPLVRSQSPEPTEYIDEEVEKRVKLIGDLTGTWGFNYQKLEGIALVTGLANTGSDPPPSPQRQALMAEMQSHEVANPNQVLASPETAMVIVRGYLPPGCQKGDPFDIEVRIAPRTETSSLRGGWLMQTRLRETEFLGNSVKTGHVLALAQGPVIVDAVFQGAADPVLETRGRVQGGGVATKDRLMGLVVKSEFHSVRTSSMIGTAVNSRFHTHDRGVKTGMAKPKDDNYVELKLHPRYKHNIARYLRTIRNIAINENTADRANRLMLLERMVMDPSTVANASLQLEAIGKDGIPLLKRALASNDPEVRFYTAEALAYLDERECTTALKEAAEREPAFRWHALTALASMDHVDAYAALNDLMHVTSAETRYGAFRALRTRNPDGDPVTRGKAFHQEFTLHAIPSSAEPMVHFTQSSRPEIVVFNDHLRIAPVDFLLVGKHIVVKRAGENELRVSRFEPGKEDQVAVCSTQLTDCIRTVAELGGHYQEMLQLVHEAKKQGFIGGKVVVDAIPQSSRLLEKQLDEIAANDVSARRRAANPLPEMFQNRLARDSEKQTEDEDVALAAAAEAERVAAHEEASKKKGVWSKMMWWK